MAAGNATIGALRVTLGADTADLEKGLKSSQTALAAFAGAVAGGMAAVATRAIAFGEQIAGSMAKIVTDMGKLHDTSQKLGVPVEQLSILAYQAELADVSFESLSKASVKLSKAMVSSVSEPTGEAANAFKQLGISSEFVRQNLNNQPAVMAAIADAYSKLQDGAGKTANATALFGKAGADLIPMLNEGKAALQESADEARRWGLVVSAEGAAAADAFGDNMTRLGKQTKGVFVRALEEVLPTMAAFTEQLVKAKEQSGFLEIAFVALSTTFKVVMSAVIQANALFDQLTKSITTLLSALAFAATGGFAKALDTINQGLAGAADIAGKAKQQISDLWSGEEKARAHAAAVEKNAENLAKLPAPITAAKNALDQFLTSQAKHLAGMNAQIQTLGGTVMETEQAKVMTELYTRAQEAGLTVTQAQADKARLLGEAIGAARVQLEGYQTTMANLSPQEKMNEALQKYDEQLKLGAISAQTYERVMARVAQSVTDQWTSATASLAGGFSQMFSQMSKQGSEFAAFAKALAIVEATINTYAAFTKALSGGIPPFNYILAAGVLAAGMAKVMAIQSQTIPKAAVGFSGIVPGGFGGGDSKLFQAMVEPGEQVDITPGTDVTGGRRGTAVVEVRGMGPGRYSLDEVKEIMRGIGDAMGFGYKFVSA